MRLDAGCSSCTAHSLQGQRRVLYYKVPLWVGELHTEAPLSICSSLGFNDPSGGSSVLEKSVREAWASPGLLPKERQSRAHLPETRRQGAPGLLPGDL